MRTARKPKHDKLTKDESGRDSQAEIVRLWNGERTKKFGSDHQLLLLEFQRWLSMVNENKGEYNLAQGGISSGEQERYQLRINADAYQPSPSP